MLFGGEKIIKKIVQDALTFAKENEFLLIFGAVVGGCSKGVQYPDSDYDTRFLYLDKKTSRIFYPMQEKEDTLKHRKYFDEAVSPYEWIPLWEATSFFQLLNTPGFDGKISLGLYNTVGWTLQSPYTWDPYGLTAKLMPFVNSIFRKEYYIPYHAELIRTYWTSDDKIVYKDYIYAIYEALCVLYADKYNVFPPVYMKTLAASLLEEELTTDIFSLIHEAQEYSEKFCRSGQSKKMHDSHFKGTIAKNPKYDEIITKALMKSEHIEGTDITIERINQQINRIYRVMEESVYHEQKVYRAMD